MANKTMKQSIVHIALVVDDYDDAIKFYTEKLNFTLIEDTVQSETKRWVKVAPKGAQDCCLLLAKAVGDEQQSRVGNQTGGRVFLFLQTDDFWRDYKNMQLRNINFIREPKREEYGTVAVFEDLYGNLWDLVEFKK
jgi:catechol 2,3-dioxygenase-like lactoylglutathione lyase family enzyme